MVILAVATVVVLGGSGEAKALTVTLESLDETPEHPFTPSVVAVSISSAKAFGTKAHRGVSGSLQLSPMSVQGDASRLYGVSSTSTVCDQTRLVKLIMRKKSTAQAWAEVWGTSQSQIPTVVGRLTPVLLSRDVTLTDYRYMGGQADPTQAVLQAGTAVLIDVHGAPRVRCMSGNPLGPPQLSGPTRVAGIPWSGFDGSSVVTVKPTPKPVTSIPAADISTGKPVTATLGGTVSLDGYLVSDDKGVSVVSFDGRSRTRIINHPVAQAYADGAGGIIYQEAFSKLLRTGGYGDYSEYDYQVPSNGDEAAIWHLAAGQTDPVKILAPDNPDTTMFELLSVGSFNKVPSIIYTSTPFTDLDPQTAKPGNIELRLRPVSSDDDRVADSMVAISGHSYYAAYLTNSSVLYASSGDDYGSWTLVDEGFNKVTTGCVTALNPTDSPCSGIVGIGPDGSFVAHAGGYGSDPTARIVIIDPATATELKATNIPPPATGSWDDYILEFDVAGDNVAVSYTGHDGEPDGDAKLFDLKDESFQNLPVAGVVRILRQPIIRPASTSAPKNQPQPAPSTTATTSAPTTTAPMTPRQLVESGTGTNVKDYRIVGSGPYSSWAGTAAFSSPSNMIKCFAFGPSDATLSDFTGLRCMIFGSPPGNGETPEAPSSFPQLPPTAECAEAQSQAGIAWFQNIIFLDSSGAQQGDCVSEQVVSYDGKVLPYDSTLNIGPFTCHIDQAGLTCMNAGDRGFFMSQTDYRTFG